MTETPEAALSPARRRAIVAEVFDSVADDYDSVGVPWFGPVAEGLVSRLNPVAGQHALDLGCGRGAALFALAEAVGPGGAVTGVDLAPRMVEAVRREAVVRGVKNVRAHVMDAASPSLPRAEYDVATASFVLFFLPAPVAALRAWRALLIPGGRLGVSTFTDHAAGWLDDVFQRFLPRPALPAPSPFDTDEGVEGLFKSAGYDGVRTEQLRLTLAFRDLDHWRRWSWSHGQRAVWERIPARDHARVQAAVAERLAPFRTGEGGYRVEQRVRLTLATRPGT